MLTLRAEQVRDAWRINHVRRGFFGTVLITIGSFTPAYLPQASPFWPAMRALKLDNPVAEIIGTGLVLAGVALLVSAWFRLRPWGDDRMVEAYRHVRHWAVLIIWGGPFVLAPPIFSHDAYSYAAQGWLVHNGINPYEQGPGVLPGGFADQVAWVWRFTPAPYGPLSLQLQHFLVDLVGHDPYISAVVMRVPALVGVALIGALLPRLAARMKIDPASAAWFATLNPVLVIDFIGGAHNDALMMGLVVLALWLTRIVGWGWVPGAVIIGVAAAIKQPALLAAYALPLVHRPWRRLELGETLDIIARAMAAMTLAIGTFAGVSWLTGLGFGWLNAVNVPGLVVTVSPFTVIGQALSWVFDVVGWQSGAEGAVRWSRSVGLLTSVAIVGTLAVTVARRRPMTFLSYSYLAVAICAPALHSWYVLWGGLLLPLAKPSPKAIRVAVWATVVLLSYAAINLAFRNGALSLGVAAIGLYFWQSRTEDLKAQRRHRRAARQREKQRNAP
ncbi:polyprenol phosphomannose-dependent alpha 1,6 mannosyltransferase MptB [Propionibacteriaceae bacterium G1746]|uniref:polyprenol phosphomannose-dependent alpha 1,6 mannosyltransferase MptB n=1 Tax=Aestuariimicrobium sp. G57 TaxID=3418485 RepID=UPI003C27A5CD